MGLERYSDEEGGVPETDRLPGHVLFCLGKSLHEGHLVSEHNWPTLVFIDLCLLVGGRLSRAPDVKTDGQIR